MRASTLKVMNCGTSFNIAMRFALSVLVWILSILVVLILFPVSLIIWFITYPFDEERRIFHKWMLIHGIIISWMIPLRRIKVEGRDKYNKDQTYIIVSNHQSILDILILNRLRYRFRWISKIENMKVPVLGWYLLMAKYITIDRGNPESKALMMQKSLESIRKRISIMIFPEGTRSLNGQLGPFKLGAFQLAIMADKPVLPVIVDGTGNILPKHGIVFGPGNVIRLKVLDPIYPGSFGTGDPEELAVKLRNLMTEELEKLRNETGIGDQ